MKKTNLIKIFAPVVAIALLIGALVGISAFAAETPEIISMNVEYGSELYLYYAVDKASVEGTPALEVVTADGTVIKTVTKYEEETVNGVPCYIFKTAGIAPGQINAIEYVRASGDNGKGDIVSYSVEEYLYTRLFKQGFAAKTEADGKDYVRRNLYFGLLEYGRSAQNLFYRDSEDKIADSIFVAIKGNAQATGEYAVSDVITLAAPAIEGFDYWKVTELSPFGKTISERKLSAGYEYLIANNTVIVPVTDDDAAEDVEIFDPTVITFNTVSKKFTFTGNAATYTTSVREYNAEMGEWVYSVKKDATGTGTSGNFRVTPTGELFEGATTMVVTFDLYVSSDANLAVQGNVVTNEAKTAGLSSTFKWAPFLYSKKDTLIKGAWNSYKIVYTPTTEVTEDGKEVFSAYVYINDKLVESCVNKNYSKEKNYGFDIPQLTDIYGFEFAFNNAASGSYMFDNVSLVFE